MQDWQHPYVNVFRKFSHLIQVQGDTTENLDPQISKRVWKIQGGVSAKNYIAVPGTQISDKGPGSSLGLSGQYIYLQMRGVGNKFFTVHFDFVVADRTDMVERITLTNMQKETKAQARVVLYPLHLPKDLWTTVRVNVMDVLQTFSFRKLLSCFYLKKIQICSSCVVRNVWTSDICFTSHSSLPRDMKFSQKDGVESSWVNVPYVQSTENQVPPEPTVNNTSFLNNNNALNASLASRYPENNPVSPVKPMDHVKKGTTTFLKTSEAAAEGTTSALDMSTTNMNNTLLFSANNKSKKAIDRSRIVDPLLSVDKLLGQCSKKFACWLTSSKIIIASSTALILRDLDVEDRPPYEKSSQCFFGHSRPIELLCASPDRQWVASAQNSSSEASSIRLWAVENNNSTLRCYTILSCPTLQVLKSMDFDPLSKYLAVSGVDTSSRHQIFLFDISRVLKGGNAALAARQMSDWDLEVMKFSPFEEGRIVSCGRENIRFWRVKDSHLPGQSVVLNCLGRGTLFTDLCFEASRAQWTTKNSQNGTFAKYYGEDMVVNGGTVNTNANYRVFVATANGEVCVVSYKDRKVLLLHKLHGGKITSICSNDQFCVTGSTDKYLRVCPLDFQCFYLHCMHEAEVQGVDVTNDGLKVLSCSSDASVGVLDMQSQAYEVVYRSHGDVINDAFISVGHEEFITVSQGGFIKVWSLGNMKQHTEFCSVDPPICVAAHPRRRLITVGFKSGTVRIFDVDGPCVSGEFTHFTKPIKSIAFAEVEAENGGNNTMIVACDVSGQVVLYDEAQSWQVVRNPDLFSGIQEPAPEGCPYIVLSNSHRHLLKYYDARAIGLFQFQRLEFTRRFKISHCAITYYGFSYDSTKVLIGTEDSRLKIYDAVEDGRLQHDISLVAGPVYSAALTNLLDQSSDEMKKYLLFTACSKDTLIKVSVLDDNSDGPAPEQPTVYRAEEQCFVGHATAPFKLFVTSNALFAVSKTEVITWTVNGGYFNSLQTELITRQNPLPAALDKQDEEMKELLTSAMATSNSGAGNKSMLKDQQVEDDIINKTLQEIVRGSNSTNILGMTSEQQSPRLPPAKSTNSNLSPSVENANKKMMSPSMVMDSVLDSVKEDVLGGGSMSVKSRNKDNFASEQDLMDVEQAEIDKIRQSSHDIMQEANMSTMQSMIAPQMEAPLPSGSLVKSSLSNILTHIDEDKNINKGDMMESADASVTLEPAKNKWELAACVGRGSPFTWGEDYIAVAIHDWVSLERGKAQKKVVLQAGGEVISLDSRGRDLAVLTKETLTLYQVGGSSSSSTSSSLNPVKKASNIAPLPMSQGYTLSSASTKVKFLNQDTILMVTSSVPGEAPIDEGRIDVFRVVMGNLKLSGSAQLPASLIDVVVADMDENNSMEFLTLTQQSLIFWRVVEEQDEERNLTHQLQFQQSDRPAWVTQNHCFTCFTLAYDKREKRNLVLCGTSKGMIVVYDFEENELIYELGPRKGVLDNNKSVNYSLNFIGAPNDFSPNSMMIVIGNGTAVKKCLINLEEGNYMNALSLEQSDRDFKSAEVHLDGAVKQAQFINFRDRSEKNQRSNCILATRTSLWFLNWKKNEKARLHTFHDSLTYQVRAGEKGTLATCSQDGLVRLWNCNSNSTIAGVAQFSGLSACLCMCFLNPRILLCGFADGCLRLFDIENLTSIGKIEVDSAPLVEIERTSSQAVIVATGKGRILQVVVRLGGSTSSATGNNNSTSTAPKEVLDARRAELKPESENAKLNVATCLATNECHSESVNTRLFIAGFKNSEASQKHNEVWAWRGGRNAKPELLTVWVLPGADHYDKNFQAAFLSESRIIAVRSNTLHVYQLLTKTMTNRIQLDEMDAGASIIALKNNVEKKMKWAESSLLLLNSKGELGELCLWDDAQAAKYNVITKNSTPGVGIEESNDKMSLDLVDNSIVVKSQIALSLWSRK